MELLGLNFYFSYSFASLYRKISFTCILCLTCCEGIMEIFSILLTFYSFFLFFFYIYTFKILSYNPFASSVNPICWELVFEFDCPFSQKMPSNRLIKKLLAEVIQFLTGFLFLLFFNVSVIFSAVQIHQYEVIF